MSAGNKLARLVYTYSPSAARSWMVTLFSSRRGKIKFGPRFYEYLVELERSQWCTTDELRALQELKIRSLAHYVAQYVPYYQTLFREHGIQPEDIRTAADLRQVPLLDKATLQNRGSDLRSVLYRKPGLVEHFQSSGTTGKPVEMFVTKDCLQLEKAFMWLHRSWGGIEIGDPTAAFVGFPVVPLRQKSPPFWVHDRSENRMMYSLQHMSHGNLRAYADSLVAYQPRMIYGYPTAIYLMALHLHEVGEERVRPTAIFTASETLLPHQREDIERAFGCRVFDWYGATELIANIVQCDRGNYHIKDEYGVVEILRPDGVPSEPGEPGEIVGTGLNNPAMPLLRYRIGDMAVRSEGRCDCGRSGELVASITGRTEDVIVTPDGRWLSRLDFVFKGMTNVEEAQLVQEARDHLRIRIVKRGGYSENDENTIRANLEDRLGKAMRFDFEYLERIPRTRSGKFRYVISNVALGLGETRQTGEVLGTGSHERNVR